MNEKIELKPCPFCGGEAELKEYRLTAKADSRHVVYCQKCGVITRFYESPEAAAEAWNRRSEQAMPFGAFSVVDTKTGQYPDLEEIVLKEEWAKRLMYCNIKGFLIGDDGLLYLMDECGNYAVCPEGRFKVVEREDDRK